MTKGYHINLEVHEVSPGTIINEKDFKVEAAEMSHGTPTLAYSITLKDKVRLNKAKIKKFKLPNSPILRELQQGKDVVFNGKKIKASQVAYIDKGKKLTIVLDTAINNNAIELAKNSDLLVSESSFAKQDEEKAKEYNHMTATQAATIAKKSKSKKLILTHISQRYEHHMELIEKEARKVFKNVKIAKDFDSLKI
jgi:ribonuclease Z